MKKASFVTPFLFFALWIFLGFGCRPLGMFYEIFSTAAPRPDSATVVVSENIMIEAPVSGAAVANPFRVTGQARVFENVVSWRLRDGQGNRIASGTTEAAASDLGQFGFFDFWVVVPALAEPKVVLEIFQASAKDGSDADLVSLPLILNRSDVVDVEVFFHNNDLDPEVTCTKVFPITQKIIATESPARAAMLMLLQGPPDFGQETNYYSVMPFRSRLNDVSVSPDGVATVDFGGAIVAPLGGSCLVSGLAAEIENTLKQFPSIKEVKILLDGKADALQP